MSDAKQFVMRCRIAMLIIGVNRRVGIRDAERIFYDEYQGQPKAAIDAELAYAFKGVA